MNIHKIYEMACGDTERVMAVLSNLAMRETISPSFFFFFSFLFFPLLAGPLEANHTLGRRRHKVSIASGETR